MSAEAQHDEGGHGGGHGTTWIVTYSDMVTLLIACFIMIITFSSKETEKYGKKRDSVLYGAGGTGAAGANQDGLDLDAVVWRTRPPLARLGQGGSEMPPLYSDPALSSPADMLHSLETTKIGTLLDSYAMRVPLAMLFQSDGRLSPPGAWILHAVANNVRSLPYDIQVQVEDPGHVAKAVTLAQHFARQEAIHPGRVGVGLRESGDPLKTSVWFVYVRH